MFARVTTVAFEGIEARAVDVQVQIGPGLPHFAIVGLPDKAVAESKERVRGALNALLAARERGDARPVIAASAGNHAQGLAWAGYRLRMPVITVMPRCAPDTKVAGVAHFMREHLSAE